MNDLQRSDPRKFWQRSMPDGLCFTGDMHDAHDVEFLADRTWADGRGGRHTEQQIFDAFFESIRRARRLVLVDMFCYNDFQRGRPEMTRLICGELTHALLQQKRDHPEIVIVVITDPINTVYGSLRSAQLESLADAGISVVITDLTRLRDSNPAYSWFWRLFVRPLGNAHGGLLPNPFDSRTRATLRSYLALLNYKANHRKALLADDGDDWVGMVTSANAQDASSANVNVAIRFRGPAVEDLLETENAVLALSGAEPVKLPFNARSTSTGVTVQILTERAIKHEMLRVIAATGQGERVSLAMFFLSDREVIAALIDARTRGASINVLLDPNRESFGHRKYGIPNRPVAAELVKADIDVRWADTHGEQSHAKMMLVEKKNGEGILLVGSANMTRRNLDNFNLETDALVRAGLDAKVMHDAIRHFDMLWNNTDEQIFSVPYEHYRNESTILTYLYRFTEKSGWSTF